MTIQEIQNVIEIKVKGVWVPEHDDRGHYYRNTRDGRKVSSVTTQAIIDKPNLIPWAARIAAEWIVERFSLYCKENHDQMISEASLAFRTVRDTAGSVGTQVHDLIEEYINLWIKDNRRPVMEIPEGKDPRVIAALRSAVKFFDKYPNITPIASELLVGSNKIDAAGTLDFLVLWGNKLWLLDWKSSNSAVHDDYAIQVSAYKAFFEEMTGLEIDGCSILGLNKNYDDTKVYDIPYTNQAYSAFKHQNAIYKWQRNGRKKLIERKNRITI